MKRLMRNRQDVEEETMIMMMRTTTMMTMMTMIHGFEGRRTDLRSVKQISGLQDRFEGRRPDLKG